MSLRPLWPALILGLASAARAQYADTPYEEPTNAVPGMVVAPTALPPLGLRSPDAVIMARADVQADLKLTPQQRRRLGRVEDARREGQQELDDAANATNQNVFVPLEMYSIESYVSKQEDLNQEVDGGIAQVLNRAQRARFAQIRLQLDGPMAFADPAVLAKLNVDEDQAEQIRIILADAREQMVQNAHFPLTTRDVPRRDGTLPPTSEKALQERLAEARVANDRLLQAAFGRISRVLRKHQWDTYLKLRGAPFAAFGRSTAPASAQPPATAVRRPIPTAGSPD